MIVINAALRTEMFRKSAEEEGLVFMKKTGIKMEFDNPNGNDEEKAEILKKKFKATKEMAALAFNVTAQ